MELSSTQIGAITVVTPKGRIDHAQAPLFQQAMQTHVAACTSQGSPLLLDFSGVDYISSVGLRALMLIARTVGAQKGKVAIAALQPTVREVFEISRFHLVVKIYDTVESGAAAMAGPP